MLEYLSIGWSWSRSTETIVSSWRSTYMIEYQSIGWSWSRSQDTSICNMVILFYFLNALRVNLFKKFIIGKFNGSFGITSIRIKCWQ
jgi:hypothetical protein